MTRKELADDPVVQALLASTGDAATPEEAIQRLCNELLTEADVSIPVDLDVLASYRGVRDIKQVDQDEAGCIYGDDAGLHINVRQSDRYERQRFTIGHEITHTFFPSFEEQHRYRRDMAVGLFDRSAAEEYLCDIGGSELLLPRTWFQDHMPSVVTIDTIIDLADMFHATLEATALRAVSLATRPSAVVVLEPGWRVSEERQIARARYQGSLPGMDPELPAAKLRVRWAHSEGLPLIPKRKSVADDCALSEVLELGSVEYVGETGLPVGVVRVSARHLPYRREDEMVDRVIAFLEKP